MLSRIEDVANKNLTDQTKRQWGNSIILMSESPGSDGKIHYREKILIINPGQHIPLESHLYHDEILVSKSDIGVWLEDDSANIVQHNIPPMSRVHITHGKRHSIFNPNNKKIYIFEIQTGTIVDTDKKQYLREDKEIYGQ